MTIINRLAHKDLRATYLNLYTALGMNVPWALGLIVLGRVISAFDSTVMMLVAAEVSPLAVGYFLLFVPPDLDRTPESVETIISKTGFQKSAVDEKASP
ncbi:MAG TPA: hypothetical protein ENN69_04830 [Spirochaetia bacterium]|nr:hypothetical protein [Spirochaetia bacterium]